MLAESTLEIGYRETFRFVDADGDVVDVGITGTWGQLSLVEAAGDELGNDDGVLEDGEEIGAIRVVGATTDFRVEIVHRGDLGIGDAVVRLGHIDATGQSMARFVTIDGPALDSTYEATSFRAGHLIAGGELRIDRIGRDASGAGLVLESVGAGAVVAVTDTIVGRLVVRDGLLGTIHVGGSLQAGLVVGGDLDKSAHLEVLGDVEGDLLVVGAFGGRIDIGSLRGNTRVLGHVLEAANLAVRRGMIGSATFARNFDGRLTVGTVWSGNLTVSGDLGATGDLRTGSNLIGDVDVFGEFRGSILVGGRTYGDWRLHRTVHSTARVIAGSSLTRVHAYQDFDGQFVAAASVVLEVDGNIGNPARIGSAVTPFVSARARKSFFGALHSANVLHLAVRSTVGLLARVVAVGTAQIVYGDLIDGGATVRAGTLRTDRVADVESGLVLAGNGPFVIRESGRYRLANDIEFTGGTGAAITILASDVTLDLDGHAVTGTFGHASLAEGIRSYGHSRVTVRNGTVGGFLYGVRLFGEEGHVVERVLSDANLYIGLWIDARGSALRNNVVRDHGGSAAGKPYVVAIALKLIGPDSITEGNIVTGSVRRGVRELVGLHVDFGPAAVIRDNVIDLHDFESSFAVWVNAGDELRGLTSVAVTDNVFSRSIGNALFASAGIDIGVLGGNLALNSVRQLVRGLNHRDGIGSVDVGGNLAVRRAP